MRTFILHCIKSFCGACDTNFLPPQFKHNKSVELDVALKFGLVLEYFYPVVDISCSRLLSLWENQIMSLIV